MAIHRKTGSGFTNIFNEGARDTRLSWEAKGLLWFLLTEPSEVEIEAAKKEDPELFDSMIDDLREGGYLIEWSKDGDRQVFDSKECAVEWADSVRIAAYNARFAIGGVS